MHLNIVGYLSFQFSFKTCWCFSRAVGKCQSSLRTNALPKQHGSGLRAAGVLQGSGPGSVRCVGDSTAFLGSLCQCIMTLLEKKFFLVSNLKLLWHNVKLLPVE